MKSVFVLLFFALGFAPAVAQSIVEVENKIKDHLEGISYWRFRYSPEDTSFRNAVSPKDSLASINNSLFNYIVNGVSNQPGILRKAPVLPENADMTIVSSADKKFSIYSWDTHMGGNAHYYYTVGLYQGVGIVKADTINYATATELDKIRGGQYEDVLTISGTNGKKYYLAIYKTMLSDKEQTKTIAAYTIEKGTLTAANIFDINGRAGNIITYGYDYMSNYDFEKMKEEYNVHLSKNGKKLYVPVSENNILTGKWQVYDFDGSKFVYDK